MLVRDGVKSTTDAGSGELGAVAVVGQEIVQVGILELSFDLLFLGYMICGRAEIAQILQRACCVDRGLL